MLAVLSSQVQAQKQCSPTDKFDFMPAKLKMRPVQPNGGGVKRTIGGTFEVLDGCTFQLKNFTISPPGKAAYFYGLPKGQNTDDMIVRVVAAPLGSYNGQMVQFKLSGASWSDMDGLALWSEEESRMLGKVLWVADLSDVEESGSKANTITYTLLAMLAAVAMLL